MVRTALGQIPGILECDLSMTRQRIIYALFFLSGTSGLMYEVVWLRMLTRITGVTTYATSTVLAAFMAGMALGSLLLGRYIDSKPEKLKIYATLELLIGISAVVLPSLLNEIVPVYGWLHKLGGENAGLGGILRGGLSFFIVLVPTTLMGGTLPVIGSYLVRKDHRFGRHLSMLYGLNTLGGVMGVLVSGFVTIGALGEMVTIYIGAGINLLVASTAYKLGRLESSADPPKAPPGSQTLQSYRLSPYSYSVRRFVLVAAAVGGLTALAYEVIWTRHLILFLRTSIYAFSGMLALYLCGIALGGVAVSRRVVSIRAPLSLVGWLEILLGVLSVVNLYLFSSLDCPWPNSFIDYLKPVCATWVIVFPITFVLGMIFPIMGVCYAPSVDKTGASIGALYAANTLGSIVGSLSACFFFIPIIGSTSSISLLASVNVILGVILLALEPTWSFTRKLSCAPIVIIFVLLAFGSLHRDPFLTTIQGRVYAHASTSPLSGANTPSRTEIDFHREGIQGTVTALQVMGSKQLWIDGVGMTGLGSETKLMAHLPILFAKDPKDFLVICFGMGTTVRSALLYPDMKVTSVELVPEVYETFKYFHPGKVNELNNKNVELIVDDGRNYLQFTAKKFDCITVDPAPPVWSAGTVNLYTKEFITLCRNHLNPNGAMCLWFPGYTRDVDLSILKTFTEVFAYTSVWSGPHLRGYYIIGMLRPQPWTELRANVNRAFREPWFTKDLTEFDHSVESPQDLLRLLLWDEKQAREWANEGSTITDNYPYTEFFLWRILRGKRGFWGPAREIISK